MTLFHPYPIPTSPKTNIVNSCVSSTRLAAKRGACVSDFTGDGKKSAGFSLQMLRSHSRVPMRRLRQMYLWAATKRWNPAAAPAPRLRFSQSGENYMLNDSIKHESKESNKNHLWKFHRTFFHHQQTSCNKSTVDRKFQHVGGYCRLLSSPPLLLLNGPNAYFLSSKYHRSVSSVGL